MTWSGCRHPVDATCPPSPDPESADSAIAATASSVGRGEPMSVRDIPDPAALGFKAPKWAAAQKEHARLQRQHTETLALQGDLRRRLGEAQDTDSRAYADAIRAGKGDPGMPATDATKSEQEAVVRKAAA